MGHVILLTGATGMVGQALVPELAARANVSQIFALAHKAAVSVCHEKVLSISGNVQAGSGLGLADEIRDRIALV
jgi:uncharacterized protein YbjT (DUF2867 family)